MTQELKYKITSSQRLQLREIQASILQHLFSSKENASTKEIIGKRLMLWKTVRVFLLAFLLILVRLITKSLTKRLAMSLSLRLNRRQSNNLLSENLCPREVILLIWKHNRFTESRSRKQSLRANTESRLKVLIRSGEWNFQLLEIKFQVLKLLLWIQVTS